MKTGTDDSCGQLQCQYTLQHAKNHPHGTSRNVFIKDTSHLKFVLGESDEHWFESLTAQKLKERSTNLPTLSVIDSPMLTPRISQLLQNDLKVGSSPGSIRHSSPLSQSILPTHLLLSPHTPDVWEKPFLGLSPSPISREKSSSLSGQRTPRGLNSLRHDDSGIVWTNSLFTPPRDPSNEGNVFEECDDSALKGKELVRALFSPGNRLDSTSDSVVPLDSTAEDNQSDVSIGNISQSDEHLNQSDISTGNISQAKLHNYSDNLLSSQDSSQSQNLACYANQSSTSTHKMPNLPKSDGHKLLGEQNIGESLLDSSQSSHLRQFPNRSGTCVNMSYNSPKKWKENFKQRLLERKDSLKGKQKSDNSKMSSTESFELTPDKPTVSCHGDSPSYGFQGDSLQGSLSPTFSSQKARKKYSKCKKSVQKSSVEDILSDFFDSPSASVGKRKPAPGRKRKSLELEDDGDELPSPQTGKVKLAIDSTVDQNSNEMLADTGNASIQGLQRERFNCSTPKDHLRSILSSDKKRRESNSDKKVSFCEVVREHDSVMERKSILRGIKETGSSKKKRLIRKVKFEDLVLTHRNNNGSSSRAKDNKPGEAETGESENHVSISEVNTRGMMTETVKTGHHRTSECKNIGDSGTSRQTTVKTGHHRTSECKNMGDSGTSRQTTVKTGHHRTSECKNIGDSGTSRQTTVKTGHHRTSDCENMGDSGTSRQTTVKRTSACKTMGDSGSSRQTTDKSEGKCKKKHKTTSDNDTSNKHCINTVKTQESTFKRNVTLKKEPVHESNKDWKDTVDTQDMFSQVSPSAIQEMCSVAEQSEIIETLKETNVSAITSSENNHTCQHDVPAYKTMSKLSDREDTSSLNSASRNNTPSSRFCKPQAVSSAQKQKKNFMYPSVSQITPTHTDRMFKFRASQEEPSAKKSLVVAVTVQDIVPTSDAGLPMETASKGTTEHNHLPVIGAKNELKTENISNDAATQKEARRYVNKPNINVNKRKELKKTLVLDTKRTSPVKHVSAHGQLAHPTKSKRFQDSVGHVEAEIHGKIHHADVKVPSTKTILSELLSSVSKPDKEENPTTVTDDAITRHTNISNPLVNMRGTCAGFKSASGRSLNLSAGSYEKAAKLLEEDLECPSVFNNPPLKRTENFTSAPIVLGKKSSVCTESLKPLPTSDNKLCSPVNSEIEAKFTGFQTASGKSFQTSTNSLLNAAELLEEDHQEQSNGKDMIVRGKEMKKCEKKNDAKKYPSSDCKEETLPAMVVANDNDDYEFSEWPEGYNEEIDGIVLDAEALPNDKTDNVLGPSELVSTAVLPGTNYSEKLTSVLKTCENLDSHARECKGSKEICLPDKNDCNEFSEETEVVETKRILLQGFSTASGSKIKLSKSSLDKAKCILNENESNMDQCFEEVDKVRSGILKRDREKPVYEEFSKASSKQSNTLDWSMDSDLMHDKNENTEKLDGETHFEQESMKHNKTKPSLAEQLRKELDVPESNTNLEEKINFFETFKSKRINESKKERNVSKPLSLHKKEVQKTTSKGFPSGANVPQGFRPFKPPMISKSNSRVGVRTKYPESKLKNWEPVTEKPARESISELKCQDEPRNLSFSNQRTKASTTTMLQNATKDVNMCAKETSITPIGKQTAAHLKEISIDRARSGPTKTFTELVSDNVSKSVDLTTDDIGDMFDEEMVCSQYQPQLKMNNKARDVFHNTATNENIAQGFATASGKDIILSINAFDKAQSLLSEEVATSDIPTTIDHLVKDTFFDKPANSDEVVETIMNPMKQNSGARKVSENSSTRGSSSVKMDTDTEITTIDRVVPQSVFKGKDIDTGLNNSNTKFDFETPSILNPTSVHVKSSENSHSKYAQEVPAFLGFSTMSVKCEMTNDKASMDMLNIEKLGDSGKGLKISDQALKYPKDVSNDDNDQRKVVNFGGFSTASGRLVTVSDKALKHARGVLDSDSSAVTNVTSFEGFSIASGKIVEVPDIALEYVRGVSNAEQEQRSKAPETGSSILVSTKIGGHERASDGVDKPTPKGAANCGLVGFSTASGNSVSVSEKALMQARCVLNDDQDEVTSDGAMFDGVGITIEKSGKVFNKPLENTRNILHVDDKEKTNLPKVEGFTTASGKLIVVPKESLDHARGMLNDSNDMEGNPHVPNEDKDSKTSLSISKFKGFSTAFGNGVNVPEKVLEHASDVLDNAISMDKPVKYKSAGHSTSSGRKSNVSQTALQQGVGDMNVDVDDVTPEFAGFRTASGNIVPVSDKALKDARNVLEDNDCTARQTVPADQGSSSASGSKVPISSSALENDGSNAKQGMPAFQGFSTASGKIVKVSEKAVKQAKGLLDDDNDVQHVPTSGGFGRMVAVSRTALEHVTSYFPDKDEGDDKDVSVVPQFRGFSTASGSIVHVSTQALQHAEGVLSDSDQMETQSVPKFGGFTTASGSTVQVSNQALQHAKGVLSDNEQMETQSVPKFGGFRTASGSTVQVSEESLQHAKGVLNDNNEKDSHSVPNFEGFNTARGSMVQVSEKAFKHARGVLSDEGSTDLTKSTRGLGESTSGFGGFSTASGKTVAISEKALQHARGVLESDKEVSIMEAEEMKVELIGKIESHTEVNNQRLLEHGLLKSGTMQNEIKMVSPRQCSDTLLDEDQSPIKRQKLDIGAEKKQFVPAGVETERRRKPPIRSGPEGTTTDRRHPGFRPFKPVHSRFLPSTNSSDRRPCDNVTALSKVNITPGVKPSTFQTPYKSTPKTNMDNQIGTQQTNVQVKTPIFLPKSALFQHAAKEGVNVKSIENKENRSSEHYAKTSDTSAGSSAESGDISYIQKPIKNINICRAENVSEMENGKEHKIAVYEQKTALNIAAKCDNKNQSDTDKHQPIANRDVGQSIECLVAMETNECDEFSQDSDGDVYYCMLVEARACQREIIERRQQGHVQPVPGRLWKIKAVTERGLQLRDVIDGQGNPAGICRAVTAKTAGEFRFTMSNHYSNSSSHVLVGDGAYLVPDDEGTAGKQEFYRALLTVEGVDRRLISEDWVSNHYRWIVWKLAAYQLTSSLLAPRCLSPETVMLQLKYRYDREIDRTERSCIKKIYERDDTPGKRMVLCVVEIHYIKQDGSMSDQPTTALDDKVQLYCTDGWYGIPVQLDIPLTDLVRKGKIHVGCKLCMAGVELVGGEDACTPLEAPVSLMLKLSCNSTRPVSWDSRLGYQRDPRPLCVPLTGLSGEGGTVGVVDVVIVRKYPMMYMEKLSGGGCVFRSQRSEDRARHEYEAQRSSEMEKLFNDLEKEMENEHRQGERRHRSEKLSRLAIEQLQTGQEIYEAMETSCQPDMIQTYLSDSQLAMLYEYRRDVEEQKRCEINSRFQSVCHNKLQSFPERQVTPILKFRLSGCATRDMDTQTSTILTVWRPSAEICDLEEGHRYKIYSLNTSLSRSKYCGHCVQLTATKQTRFRRMSVDENFLDRLFEPREVSVVADIKHRQPVYGELDFVGLVVKVTTAVEGERNGDIVHVVDSQGGLLTLRFWNGIKGYGCELFTVCNPLCCSNLLDKSTYRNKQLPVVDVSSELTSISNKPANSLHRAALAKLNMTARDKKLFIEEAQLRLNDLLFGRKHTDISSMRPRVEDFDILMDELKLGTNAAPRIDTSKPASKVDHSKSGPRIDTFKPGPRIDTSKPGPRIDTSKPGPRIDTSKPDSKADNSKKDPRTVNPQKVNPRNDSTIQNTGNTDTESQINTDSNIWTDSVETNMEKASDQKCLTKKTPTTNTTVIVSERNENCQAEQRNNTCIIVPVNKSINEPSQVIETKADETSPSSSVFTVSTEHSETVSSLTLTTPTVGKIVNTTTPSIGKIVNTKIPSVGQSASTNTGIRSGITPSHLPGQCSKAQVSPDTTMDNTDMSTITSTPVNKHKSAVVQSKMAKLLAYGSPSILSPLNTPVSRSVTKRFKPPSFKID